ncbi:MULTISPECIES: alpha/beta hydrolase fold domain-containing protein [unclassified Streptomyces]|uniref:alpha/beta hydrolase fold domain-containing protein n=1 Tax=unclassified Streptomyces TaxID=2593676 RepID=UPI002E2FD57B|nr:MULTISPECIES: alpha/beta hydrolase fold domain-containing protein [unclassified Streptomyces]WUC66647.1 alpha/beta hydrolase [Streptomyces sp. NBC_00539]
MGSGEGVRRGSVPATGERRRGPAPRAAPPLDPELGAALAANGSRAPEPLTPANLADRQRRDAARRPRPTVEELGADGRFEVAELRVPGPPDGPEVTLVSARPAGLAGRPLPLLYYMHGGGLVMGNAWSVLPRILREWVLPLELAVISVEYRLAPRTQYPGPLEDCYAGLVWAAGHAGVLGIDADRIVIGGKSAGAGLAAALALLVRDRGGAGPRPLGQLLLSPMLDDRGSTFSGHRPAGHDVWDPASNETVWKAALGDRYGAADLPPYAAPARATDLSRLPAAYVEVGSAEVLRDEGVAYANAIWQAGGRAELHVWPGACHGFDSLAPRAALTRDARDARTRWLRRLLAPPRA